MDRIGRYKIVRELGRGAMGVVYHALDPNIGRPVAIKTIRIGDVRKPEDQQRLRERLLREARSAGSLSHPGIVTIYDVEQQGDLAYIAMEYVDGPTLDHLLSQRALTSQQIFSIVGQTAAALDYAHQKGIVHRDIKPANIMIAADGTTKITDFGIAKITSTDQFTMTGTIVGTPHYMSPEQVQGRAVDGRSDQFSLAVIAYEILTGEKPYTGDHLTTVVYKIVAEDPVLPHRLNPVLAGGIENVLRKGLSKKPDARYRNCQEFAEALERACTANRAWKPIARGASLNTPTVVEGTNSPRSVPKLPPARNPRLAETAERAGRKSGFVPWLVAILLVSGLLVAMGTLHGPWGTFKPLQKIAGIVRSGSALFQPKAPASPPTAAPLSAAPLTAVPKTAPAVAKIPEPAPPQIVDEKPSPMPKEKGRGLGTGDQEPVAEPAPSRRLVRPAVSRAPAMPQPINVVSSPAGATATLDSHPDSACTTPCQLQAMPGPHEVAITMTGYQIEHQEVDIGSTPADVQVVLRAQGGTLYLSSVPPGASISINGRKYSQLTPAQIALTPGTYNITVEKNGRQNTQSVVVQNGKLNLLKILLE